MNKHHIRGRTKRSVIYLKIKDLQGGYIRLEDGWLKAFLKRRVRAMRAFNETIFPRSDRL